MSRVANGAPGRLTHDMVGDEPTFEDFFEAKRVRLYRVLFAITHWTSWFLPMITEFLDAPES